MNRPEQRPIHRHFIVFCILIGLFFSNSEGVHLLPFPDPRSIVIDGAVAPASSNGLARYNFGVKTARSTQSQSVKDQKHSLPMVISGIFVYKPRTGSPLFDSVSHITNTLISSRIRLLLPEKRGPPNFQFLS